MTTPTVRQLLTGAMRLIRVVAANETPSDEDIQIARESMRGLLDSLSTDLLNIYTTQPYRFLLTPGAATYKLGPAFGPSGEATGANWLLPRPMRVERANLLQNAAVTYPSPPAPPQPDPLLPVTFTCSVTVGPAPLTVTFTNTSSPATTQSDWDFGDGTVTAGGVVTHTFGWPGTYRVLLTTENGTAEGTVLVHPLYEVSIASQTLTIPMTALDDNDYSTIGLRGLRATYPAYWYDDGNYPTRGISLWPVPAQNWAVELWCWEPLDQGTDLDQHLNLPAGYERYLRYKLAVEIAPEFGAEVPPTVMQALQEAQANVKKLNQQHPLAHLSAAARAASGRNMNAGVIDSVAFRSGAWAIGGPR